ncbi:hypothetical protein HOD08_01140, partial [bacterium]|nr:hypothetical protein [bacterium]
MLLIFLTTSYACAMHHSNKTWMTVTPPGNSLATRQSMWHIGQRDAENNPKCRTGGSLHIAGFYDDSREKNEAGQYFGIGNANTISFSRIFTGTAAFPQLDIGMLIHKKGVYSQGYSESDYLNGTMTLTATHKVLGAVVGYHYAIPSSGGNYFVRIEAPIVEVKNKLGASISETQGSDSTTLLNFLNGTYENTTEATNKQAKLRY